MKVLLLFSAMQGMVTLLEAMRLDSSGEADVFSEIY